MAKLQIEDSFNISDLLDDADIQTCIDIFKFFGDYYPQKPVPFPSHELHKYEWVSFSHVNTVSEAYCEGWLHIHGIRLETDDEYKKRLDIEERRQKAKERRERQKEIDLKRKQKVNTVLDISKKFGVDYQTAKAIIEESKSLEDKE
jgi:hypothetical protein